MNNALERHPENSRGDFYVENGVCITCEHQKQKHQI